MCAAVTAFAGGRALEMKKESGDPAAVTFGNHLRAIRTKLGMNMRTLAERSGGRLKYDRVAKWEQGINRPRSYEDAIALCDALGLGPHSDERAQLLWLAGEWIERVARLEGLPAARCRRLWGRTELVDELTGIFADPRAPRIILLAAFGGYGKTELARHVAELLSNSGAFVDVVWISLKMHDFQFTLKRIELLDVPFEPSLSIITPMLLHRLACRSRDELVSRLASEPILIVIDNLESLPDVDREGAVSLVHRLIGNGPSRALFTSRFDIVTPYVYKPSIRGLSLRATVDLLRDEAHHAAYRTELSGADHELLRRIWDLTRGMPLALHLVVGQSLHYELTQVVEHLETAGANRPDEQFYAYLFRQAWRELGVEARTLLVYLGTSTRGRQTVPQLLGIAPAPGIRFQATGLHQALGELAMWFLIEREELTGLQSQDTIIAYEIHPLTRSFILSQEMREQWETVLDEDQLRAAAYAKHREILRQSLGDQVTQ